MVSPDDDLTHGLQEQVVMWSWTGFKSLADLLREVADFVEDQFDYEGQTGTETDSAVVDLVTGFDVTELVWHARLISDPATGNERPLLSTLERDVTAIRGGWKSVQT